MTICHLKHDRRSSPESDCRKIRPVSPSATHILAPVSPAISDRKGVEKNATVPGRGIAFTENDSVVKVLSERSPPSVKRTLARSPAKKGTGVLLWEQFLSVAPRDRLRGRIRILKAKAAQKKHRVVALSLRSRPLSAQRKFASPAEGRGRLLRNRMPNWFCRLQQSAQRKSADWSQHVHPILGFTDGRLSRWSREAPDVFLSAPR